jgi:hypothetical protein
MHCDALLRAQNSVRGQTFTLFFAHLAGFARLVATACCHSLLPQRREPARVAGLEANVPNFKDKSCKLSALQRSPNSDPKNHPWRLKIHLALYRPSLHVRAYNYSGRKALLGQIRLKDEVIQTHLGTGLNMGGTPQSGL